MIKGADLFLANIGHEGIDLIALFDEPCEDARSVLIMSLAITKKTYQILKKHTQSTGISEQNTSLVSHFGGGF